MVNKQQRDLPVVTIKMNEMVINTPTSNNDINDNRHNQTSTCTLSSLAYKILSHERAAIWRQLPEKDKEVLISATSKKLANKRNKMTRNNNNPKYTHKCCGRLGTPTGELVKFRAIVDHKKCTSTT